jgi:hypothetical protein
MPTLDVWLAADDEVDSCRRCDLYGCLWADAAACKAGAVRGGDWQEPSTPTLQASSNSILFASATEPLKVTQRFQSNGPALNWRIELETAGNLPVEIGDFGYRQRAVIHMEQTALPIELTDENQVGAADYAKLFAPRSARVFGRTPTPDRTPPSIGLKSARATSIARALIIGITRPSPAANN